MTLDAELLKKAQVQEGRLTEAERQVQLARADYHTAVRRLHLAGASLREIAQALDLSHQRVQQIVGSAGGSWWRRAWRSRRAVQDAACTACGRHNNDVQKLIAGPAVFICDACVAVAERAAASGRETDLARSSRRCSFCGVRQSSARLAEAGGSVALCEKCLHTCREILDACGSAV